jgi:hypothetical protein
VDAELGESAKAQVEEVSAPEVGSPRAGAGASAGGGAGGSGLEGGADDTGSGILLSDLVYASLQSILHPLDAKCVKERLPALAQVVNAVHVKAGADWKAFSVDQRPFLRLWAVATVVHNSMHTGEQPVDAEGGSR